MDLKIKDLVADIAAAGVHPDTARNRVSYYAQQCLINGRREGKNTSPTIYQPRDSAVAIALSALHDCGIADSDLLGDCAVIHLDMDRCLAGIAAGESWSLVTHVYRGSLGIFHDVHLARHDQPAGRTMPVSMTQRGTFVVVLDEMLMPVVRRLHPLKGAH